MKVRNNTGPSTVPCGMPDFGDCHDDLNPLTQTHCLRFVRKLLSQESEERENPSADNLPIRPGMPTRSYALLRSRKAACTFSFFSLVAHTLSPSTLVTPDVGPPWPLRSRRLRSPRRSSRTQPHALLDHYLAPSNSLGHDVDFTWPRATRSATATSSPGHEHATRSATATRSLGLSNSPGLELNQQPSRSTSLDLDQSPIQPSAANSLRHRNDTASSVVSLPATSNSTSARSSLVISGSASITCASPHTWPTCLGQACRPCCLHCRYRPLQHSVSVFLSSSPSLSLFESSLTIRLGFSLFQSHILSD